MVRAGFLVDIDVLDVTAVLRDVWSRRDLGHEPLRRRTARRRGTSSTLGRSCDRPTAAFPALQAAFRTSFHLPSAAAVAVGTDNPGTWPSSSMP